MQSRHIKKYNKGYTLIELLTVMFIMTIVSGVITAMIFSVLQGSSKSRISTTLSQNGNYAMSIISSIVTSSEKVVAIDGESIDNCLSTGTDAENNPVYKTGTSITLQRSDGEETILSFTPDSSPINIASTSASTGNSVNLLDDSEVKIDTSSGKKYTFMCKQTNLYALPLVFVQFNLVPVSVKDGVSSILSQSFETQILMQNFQNN